MASIVIAGDTSGSVTLQAPAVAGSTVLNLPSTSGTIQTSGAGYTTNGVAYATSTSALATGSALTFDGSNTFLFNASAASSQANFRVQTDTTGAVANGYFNINGTDYFRIYTTSSETGLRNLQNTPMYFSVNNTEGMRLTSTGLGIGTSSPSTKLTVYDATTPQVTFNNGTSTFIVGNNSGGNNHILYGTGAYPMIFYTNATEGMRLDSAGNLGVGTSTPSTYGKLHVRGTQSVTTYGNVSGSFSDGSTGSLYIQHSSGLVQLGSDTALSFGTGTSATERARIDSSGNLLVGTTSGVGKVRIQGGAGTTPAIYAYNTNATSGDYSAVFALGANCNNTSSFFLSCTEPGVANRFVIYGNGTYATTSDQRLKKNIETTRDGYLNDLMNLRVVKYNWNSQADGEPKELGVIAQEIEQVFPSMVQESLAEGADTAYKQVKTSVLPFMLLKALQEQQAIINTLTDRISVLENK